MKRNALGAAIVIAAILIGFLLRPRGGPPASTVIDGGRLTRPEAQPPRPPPPDLRRPEQFEDLRRAVEAARERGEALEPPSMAPPPMDPSLAEREPADARSVWPATPAGIQGAVAEAMPELRECYEGWLAEDPELEGRIVASLAIESVDGTGQITAADVAEASTGHAAFEACVTSVLSELQFDPPEGGGTLSVSYPFVFTTEE